MNQKVAFIMGLFVLFLGGIATYFVTESTRQPAPEPSQLEQILADPPEAAALSEVEFSLPDIAGEMRSSSEWEGKARLINFWATWCAPCRKEMPMLSDLQAEFGGEAFEVVTIATGRNSVPGIQRFFEEIGVDTSSSFRDSSTTASERFSRCWRKKPSAGERLQHPRSTGKPRRSVRKRPVHRESRVGRRKACRWMRT